jgi:hypothetical protein
MKSSRSGHLSQKMLTSLFAVLSIGFVFSATTSLTAGPGVDHWTRKHKDVSLETSVPDSSGLPEKAKVECSGCKVVQVKSQQPSQNGRFSQTRTENKILCDTAESASAGTCCVPASAAEPSHLETSTDGR